MKKEDEGSQPTCEDGREGEETAAACPRAKFGRGLSGVKEDLFELTSSLNRLFLFRTQETEDVRRQICTSHETAPRNRGTCSTCTGVPCTSTCTTNAQHSDRVSECESDINRLIESLETSLKESSEQNPTPSVKKDLLELYSEISRGILRFVCTLDMFERYHIFIRRILDAKLFRTACTSLREALVPQEMRSDVVRPSFTLAHLHHQALDSTRKVMMWNMAVESGIKMHQLEWLDFSTCAQEEGQGERGEGKSSKRVPAVQVDTQSKQEHVSYAASLSESVSESESVSDPFDQLSIGQCSKFEQYSVISAAHSRSHSSSFVVLDNDLVF